jgi:hypothetical protein
MDVKVKVRAFIWATALLMVVLCITLYSFDSWIRVRRLSGVSLPVRTGLETLEISRRPIDGVTYWLLRFKLRRDQWVDFVEKSRLSAECGAYIVSGGFGEFRIPSAETQEVGRCLKNGDAYSYIFWYGGYVYFRYVKPV